MTSKVLSISEMTVEYTYSVPHFKAQCVGKTIGLLGRALENGYEVFMSLGWASTNTPPSEMSKDGCCLYDDRRKEASRTGDGGPTTDLLRRTSAATPSSLPSPPHPQPAPAGSSHSLHNCSF